MRIEFLVDKRIKGIAKEQAIDILEYRDDGDTIIIENQELIVCVDDMYNKSLVLNKDLEDIFEFEILEEREF